MGVPPSPPSGSLDWAAHMRYCGQQICEARERIRPKLSQRGLAEQAGLSQGMISNIERGVKLPKPHRLYRLATILGLDMVALWPPPRAEVIMLTDPADPCYQVVHLLRHCSGGSESARAFLALQRYLYDTGTVLRLMPVSQP